MVHFFLGLPILAAFLIYYQRPLNAAELVFFPLVVLTQAILTLGLALIVSALTVHFRDLRDLLSNLLTFWFFATPIIYPMTMVPGWGKRLFDMNPFTHLAVSYQEILFYDGPFGHWKWLLALLFGSILLFLFGYFVFDRLRDSFAEEV
jgi:ABC-type polysaccharide/polyol phosphate export permease